MAQPATTRSITAAAQDLLSPLGLVQKGRSRTWLGDQAWWLLGVSFAHSGFEKASYLNVFVTWLWNDRDDLTFDVGGRTRWISTTGSDVGGISFESEEQFSREARRMVEAATTQVDLYRALFVTVQDCVDYYAGQEGPCGAVPECWDRERSCRQERGSGALVRRIPRPRRSS